MSMPTLYEALQDANTDVHIWRTSVDMIIHDDSPFSNEGKALHLTFTERSKRSCVAGRRSKAGLWGWMPCLRLGVGQGFTRQISMFKVKL